MKHILEKALDELVGPKAPVLEAFFRHLDRIGMAALLDIETGLKRIDVDDFAAHSADVTNDALTLIDPVTLCVLRALMREYDDGNWSLLFTRALANAVFEIVLSEWHIGSGYWTRQFKFISLTEVADA